MPLKKVLFPLSLLAITLASPSYASMSPDSTGATNLTETTKVKQIATITNAVAKHRERPVYPMAQAKIGREGWAILSYVVETDGSVSNIIVEESSGQRSFDKAAVRATKKWQFTPAMEDGKPVQQCKNSVKMEFSLGKNNNGVSRKFFRRYKEILSLIEKDELILAKEKIDQLKTYKQWRLSEQMYFSLAQAGYAKKAGDKALELASLVKVLGSNNKDVNPELHLSTLQHVYDLDLELNRLHYALTTNDKIVDMLEDKSLIAEYQKSKSQVEDFINSNQVIRVDGLIGENNIWRHTLVRKAFSLAEIDGRVNKLDVRCANKRHVFTVDDNTSWEIPQSWQQCSVYIYGNENTQFQLIEHPDSPQVLSAKI